ncbi:hypothetical protein M3Y97_00896600 [Aphelenchoides bicaudatus]|nr:hypothetical protein M3Y97_00896600 [Aphelenchoides bicaudatus]
MARVDEPDIPPLLTISSALEELEFKYTMPLDDIEPCIKFLSSSPPKGECVKRLQQIILSHQNISELGDLNQLTEMLQNATIIDLSHNNLNDWAIIGNLLDATPSLKQLNLSFNPLDSRIDINLIPKNNRLECLMLNGVNLTLQTLATLLHSLPRLKLLQICCSPLESPDKENCGELLKFDQLTDLYMEDCSLDNWTACMQFAQKFPYLRKLYLSENGFNEIFEECNQTGLKIQEAMKNLNTLSLNTCAIEDWKSIEALGSLTTLQHLHLRDLPLFEKYEDFETRDKLTIPRIPSLQTLNGSIITKDYRGSCERFFIRFYQSREDKPQKLYDQLVGIHGNLEQLVSIDLTPQKYIRTRMRCEELDLNLIIRLRVNITIRAFINAVVKATKIPLNLIRVVHVTPQYPARSPTELRPSNQFLHTLRIEPNDEFRVFSKTVPSGVSHL